MSWASKDGKVYDLVTSTDLAAPILAWPVYDDGVNPNINNANWTDVPAIDLAAGVGQMVRIEWCFSGQAPSADYMGWYIDDVVVTETTP